MALIEQIPAIVRILMVFALFLVAIRVRSSLGNALLLGSILLGLLFGCTFTDIIRSAFLALMAPKTLASYAWQIILPQNGMLLRLIYFFCFYWLFGFIKISPRTVC